MQIRVDELPDGGMIAGKVGDDDVLLARRGDEYFALDAHCTHWHGPLAEGVLVGETVRCPWHHACFDLRTGVAIAAPAMRPLRTFTVTREGDIVRVSSVAQSRGRAVAQQNHPSTAQPRDRATEDAAPQHIVILGAGSAGSFAAHELRRNGFAGRVTLISREERLPYDKPNLSKDYLAGKAPAEWIPLQTEDEYAANNIELRLNTTVESIDAQRRELRLANGETLAYDKLILATGATPRRLQSDARIHYLRTWPDADAIIRAAEGAKKAVIIGASFIGLETAASLRERGLDVTVIGMEERPLEKQLGREIGDFIQRLHEKHGVRFRLGRKPVEIRNDAVTLDDGTSEACDLIIAGVGVIPDVALAERAGLTVNNGVVVDELLQTSDPNIYAAGDIANLRNTRIEHWVAAGRQGQAAARNAMGKGEPIKDVPFFWSQHYDLSFNYVGHATRADDAQLFGSLDETNFAAVYREEGHITAVVTLYRDDVSLAVELAMERGASDDQIDEIVKRAFA
ncbi:MAG: pyridine nucleotide-disulfide oxidoreductase [Acidobacteria bacterium]|nr:MAG: pyridine nucleotide-disulfide oxidoreductase [Acidobacteriota bacterium]